MPHVPIESGLLIDGLVDVIIHLFSFLLFLGGEEGGLRGKKCGLFLFVRRGVSRPRNLPTYLGT